MKGKLLTIDEILKLDGKYVYMEPIGACEEEKGKAIVEIDGDLIFLQSINTYFSPWVISKRTDKVSKGVYLDVYEWIEGPKTYPTSEILTILKENPDKRFKLIDGVKNLNLLGTIASNEKDFFIIRNPEGQEEDIYYFKAILFSGIWEEVEKEYMTFMDAVKVGKLIKYKGWANFYSLIGATHKLSQNRNEKIEAMLQEKAWEVEEC